jgi:hypothetical protein
LLRNLLEVPRKEWDGVVLENRNVLHQLDGRQDQHTAQGLHGEPLMAATAREPEEPPVELLVKGLSLIFCEFETGEETVKRFERIGEDRGDYFVAAALSLHSLTLTTEREQSLRQHLMGVKEPEITRPKAHEGRSLRRWSTGYCGTVPTSLMTNFDGFASG